MNYVLPKTALIACCACDWCAKAYAALSGRQFLAFWLNKFKFSTTALFLIFELAVFSRRILVENERD